VKVSPATRSRGAVAVIAALASYAQFGVTTSLGDVAHSLGHPGTTSSLVAEAGLSGSQLGVGLAVVRGASLFALIFAARADRTGRWPVIRWTTIVGLILTAVAAFSPTYWFFVACFALGRPFLSATSALLTVVTTETSRVRERVGHLAVLAAATGAGAGLAALVHSVLKSPQGFRWQFASAGLAVLLTGPLARRSEEPVVTEEHPARLGRVERRWRGRLWGVALVVAALSAVSGPANGFTFVYGENVLGFSPGRVTLVLVASSVSGLAGLLLARRVGQRGSRGLGITGGFLFVVIGSVIAYSGSRAGFVVGYLFGVGAAGFVTPLLGAMSTEIFPRSQRATTSGWLVVAGVLGALSGLLVFGAVADAARATGTGVLADAARVTFLPTLLALGALVRLARLDPAEHEVGDEGAVV
jgi:MFS family permease